ncbi:MAG: HopJ type III effector protein [Colwellia sp.]|nr:HopJ type III effector protein [Colwellia sp.]
MPLNKLLEQIKSQAELVEFSEVITVITDNYRYKPCTFHNGELVNEAGTNEGSCKIFAFAQLHRLSEQETLACFGHYYREDVLQNPQGEDHGNIRNFIKQGWQGLTFESEALS